MRRKGVFGAVYPELPCCILDVVFFLRNLFSVRLIKVLKAIVRYEVAYVRLDKPLVLWI